MPLPIVIFTSEVERKVYGEYFRRVGATSYALPSTQSVKELLRKALGVEEAVLRRVSEVALGAGNSVDQNAFNVALRLIALAQGHRSPVLLSVNCLVPLPLFAGHENVLSTHGYDPRWAISDAELMMYRPTFVALSSDNGLLSLAPVANMMRASNVPFEAIDPICRMADIDQDGKLDLDEFAVAMHVANHLRLRTWPALPSKLPDELIPPSRRHLLLSQLPISPLESVTINWDIESRDLLLYDNHFERLSDGGPSITQDKLGTICQLTNVSYADGTLAWKLVDTHALKSINRYQFRTLMHVLSMKKKCGKLPSSIPKTVSDLFFPTSSETSPVPTSSVIQNTPPLQSNVRTLEPSAKLLENELASVEKEIQALEKSNTSTCYQELVKLIESLERENKNIQEIMAQRRLQQEKANRAEHVLAAMRARKMDMEVKQHEMRTELENLALKIAKEKKTVIGS